MSMADHSVSVEWRFVVPPMNNRRILVSQRQDGVFRGDTVGGAGHYHTSVEAYVDGQWVHIPGSSTGAHVNRESAMEVAESQWRGYVAQAAGGGS